MGKNMKFNKGAMVIDGKSKNKNLNPIIIAVCVILMLYALTLFFMLGWGVLTSFKSTIDFKNNPAGKNVLGLPDPKFSAKEIAFGNYKYAFSGFKFETSTGDFYSNLLDMTFRRPKKVVSFPNFIINSFLYAILGSFMGVLCKVIVGYLCSKYKYKFSQFIYGLLLVLMIIPIVGATPSAINVRRNLGIFDSYFDVIFGSFSMTGLYFFVFYAYYQGLSDTYMEAAEIDGASQFMIMLKIVIPLASKMMGTVFLLSFIAMWNDYQTPLLYYPTHPTLVYAVWRMAENNTATSTTHRGTETSEIPQRVAGCMILAMPIIILFLALKDFIMGNVSLGGLKE